MDFTPTPEQLEILDAEKNSKDNIQIQALAGAAKTSTLVMIANELEENMLFLAFNKSIATELTKRLPSHCRALTLNSLGHRTWGQAVSGLVFDQNKIHSTLTIMVKDLKGHAQDDAWEEFAEIMKVIHWGKACGYIPDGHFPSAKRLMGDAEFFGSLDEEPSEIMERLVKEVTVVSIGQAVKGRIDFGDQIFMPTLFPALFDSYPHVLVDEMQDLSELNHMMLRKLVKKRLTGVGDENQSIYAFRGAHTKSMEMAREAFNMRSFPLSISFRCPQSVVQEARWRAPHMKWPEGAKLGQVQTLHEWTHESIPDNAVIICRNNAPIFNIAIKLLKAGRYPNVQGSDIGKGLLKIMAKFGPKDMPREEVHVAVEKWLAEKLAKARSEDKFMDQAAVMKIFADQGQNLGQAMTYAEELLQQAGPIQLMTAHKSKGLEFEDIFILDRDLIRTKEDDQEKNILYVAQTRSKSTLTYITSEGFREM